MVEIEINGTPVQARDGAMVLQAADEAGITIPRFCYHNRLSIAANCRMCLVEVEKVAKPLPACATPVAPGMKIYTRSPKAIAAQRNVMEFLLINHPLDCPICDQGGECDLQEMAVGYGNDFSRYSEEKRVVADRDIGPLIATEMTRCIHCTRCVRFGEEIAGIREMGATGRGEHMTIGTYVAKSVDSELSGNIIDLCPVGALTSKPYRFTARPWELRRLAGVSPHDCVGSHIDVDVRGQKVMRVVARENEAINESWIADRDRFSYLGLSHAERLLKPMVKRNGQWQEVDWNSALEFAAEGLRSVVSQHGAAQLGALAAYGATTEEHYLLQKVMRGLGSHNVDHRLRQIDFRDDAVTPAFPALGHTLPELETRDAVLLIGSNVRKEQPLIAHRLRKASLKGAQLLAINALDYEFTFPLAAKAITTPAGMVHALAAVAKALAAIKGASLPTAIQLLTNGVNVDAAHKSMAQLLADAKAPSLLLGNGAIAHPHLAELRALASAISIMSGAKLGILAEGGNSAGAWLAGMVPHRLPGARGNAAGNHWHGMCANGVKGLLLLGIEPEFDAIDTQCAADGVRKAEFVVSLSAYATDAMRASADVLLPIALFPETSGTYVNAEGHWQSVQGVVTPPGESRPAWKVLRVLGNMLDLPGFEYMSSEEVRDELRALCAEVSAAASYTAATTLALPQLTSDLMRVSDFPIYSVDPLVRRSAALQQTRDARLGGVRGAAATLAALGLTDGGEAVVSQGGSENRLKVSADERVATGCLYVPCGTVDGVGLGAGFAPLTARPV